MSDLFDAETSRKPLFCGDFGRQLTAADFSQLPTPEGGRRVTGEDEAGRERRSWQLYGWVSNNSKLEVDIMRNIINGGGGQPVGTITGGGGQPTYIGGGGQPIEIGGGGQSTDIGGGGQPGNI